MSLVKALFLSVILASISIVTVKADEALLEDDPEQNKTMFGMLKYFSEYKTVLTSDEQNCFLKVQSSINASSNCGVLLSSPFNTREYPCNETLTAMKCFNYLLQNCDIAPGKSLWKKVRFNVANKSPVSGEARYRCQPMFRYLFETCDVEATSDVDNS